jgi:hypothetical protein
VKIAEIRGADDKHAPADSGNFLVIEALQKFHNFYAPAFPPNCFNNSPQSVKNNPPAENE